MNSFGIGGGLLRWMKNELIWNFGGGVFYVGSKMNSFGILGGGLLRWIKNELIWNWGGSFTLDQK